MPSASSVASESGASTRLVVARCSRAVTALADAVERLVGGPDRDGLVAAVERGYFRPLEEQQLFDWFARFLSVREGLWQVVGEVSEPVAGELRRIRDPEHWHCFLLGYAAACLVVRLDRLLVEELATDSLVQRKLNEGAGERRLPRKQFTAVYESLTEPRNALLMYEAMRFARRHRGRLRALEEAADVGSVARRLATLESSLDPSKRGYVKRLVAYGEHAMRRRGASARQQVTFAALASGGRLVAEMRDRWHSKRIDAERRLELARLLEPGDILVTRHERALSNLFLPGYWPHVALYIGREEDRERLGVEVDDERRRRWSGDCCVLEALKDGVLFRPIEETLEVDAVAVLRPRLDDSEIARALSRAVEHEGKMYNFDFDFFRSDRLVCTEVVYRAYDGVGSWSIELQERAGRPTLSAEDLLAVALGGGALDPVAACGVPPDPDMLVTGAATRSVLAATIQSRSGEWWPKR